MGYVRAGDALAPQALASFVEYFARHPHCAIAYADEVVDSAQGEDRLNLKPDWSPILHEHAPYIGRAAFWRLQGEAAGQVEPEMTTSGRIAQAAPPQSVGHIRRALFRFPHEPAARRKKSPATVAGPRGQISVIIPTRDRAELLAACLDSILAAGLQPADEILIIDNDSKERETEDLFRKIQARSSIVTVMRQPGPFNFSALCNAAAQRARGDLLVFLNNDTQVRTSDWLERLRTFAGRPDVGAVGAKLLFLNETVQHQGVVLGMGGVAGHFGARASASAAGWRKRGLVPHEVSAVTAACLMVEKAKFSAVGGFDAEHLPIDLNDLDLCLRLAQCGWRTICDSRVELYHRESASRGGGGLRLQRVYARERAYFSQKWRNVIRNDPYFNPALSLYSLTECLW
jgi:GT2 family glycosyltransferase